MPLTLQKAAKPAVKEKAAAKKTDGTLEGYESIVDTLAQLETVITPEILAALKQQKRFQDELRAVADKESPADAKVVFAGTTHNFSLTEKGEQRTVVVQQARLALGDKLFNELARILLGDVDRYLSKAEQATCVTVSRSGPRKGQLVKK